MSDLKRKLQLPRCMCGKKYGHRQHRWRHKYVPSVADAINIALNGN